MLRELDSSLGNEREWRNIQKTVTTAFVKVVSVLSVQASEISALKEQLQRVEVARKKQEEEGKYITTRGFEKRCVALMRKWAEEHAADDLKTREVVKEAVAAERRKIEESQCRLHEEWTSWRSKMEENVKEMRQKWSDRSLRRTSDRKEDEFATRFDELKSETHRLEDKIDHQFSLWRQEGVKSLVMKPDRAEVVSIVEEKTVEAVNKAIQLKISSLEVIRAELDQSKQQYKEFYDAVRSLTESKAAKSDVTQLKTDLRDLLFVIEAMQREQGELREFVQPSNQRPRHQNETDIAMARVNEALKQIQRSMEHTAKKGVVDDLMEQLTSVRRQLRSEMYQARYIWTEGRPLAKQTIAWTTQVVNTNSDVFVWKDGSDIIITMIPGLYHLQAAFFTSFSPSIQVLVNGEPAVGLSSQETNLIDAKMGDVRNSSCRHCVSFRRYHHSAGDIVGIDISGFLALPARATISLSYDIDERAQGFLNLRKL